jgi:gentisate 1,2-dioxygenase
MEHLGSTEELNDQTFQELNDFLRLQRTFYNKLYNKTLDDRDDIISHLRKSEDFDFAEIKEKHRNNALADLVQNKNELSKIEEFNNRFIQLENPIYRESKSIRGHFYAPQKMIFGKKMDTYWVNLLVIWVMTLTLMVTLYFDALRKFTNLFNRR